MINKRSLALVLMVNMLCLLTMTSCAAVETPSAGSDAEAGQLASNSAQSVGFSDVPANVWYADAVAYCQQHGIMSGTSATTFAPEATLTRAMLATVLHRMSGTPTVSDPPVFMDAVDGSWYSDAVSWAAKNGIISGYGGGMFGVNDPTTREQAVTILWRYAGGPEGTAAESLSDAASISGWAQEAIRWANANGILDGMIKNSRFNPKTNIKRGEVASMLYHYLTLNVGSRPGPASGGKTLVAYFSATNTTRPLAEYAADILNADLYEIVPEIPYTDADLAYYTNGRADREQNDASARPAISGSVDNMADYDIVFIGYPIWHGQSPKIIYTFLESYDFTGKTIVPFCTSHSSGIGSSDTNLHSLVNDANWLAGRRFAGGASRSTMEDWINGLELPSHEAASMNKINVSFNGHIYPATLADNPSAEAFAELLKSGPLTIVAHDYGSFEKVGALGTDLPRSDEQITTAPGDIILYQGDQITVYYAQNTWNFTRLGRIDDPSGLREALGSGDVEITFQLAPSETLPYDGVYPQHEPYGTGTGAMPGRVVWAHDPDCVEWDGNGYWWELDHFDETAIQNMVNNSITSLGGKKTVQESWKALFKAHNQSRGKTGGYAAGEKIAIKANINGSAVMEDDTSGETKMSYTNPVLLKALIISLVEEAGVRPADITVYDVSRLFPDYMVELCTQGNLKGVHFVGRNNGAADQSAPIQWSYQFSGKVNYLPTCVTEAEYVINLANLKGHSYGITLCGKNHFGSFINGNTMRPPEGANLHQWLMRNEMGIYSPLVDLMANADLGGKTVLYMLDAIICAPSEGASITGDNSRWQQDPFNNHYTSSVFVSQDPVAIDSVGADFLMNEPAVTSRNGSLRDDPTVENYLHEAGLVSNPPSGTTYTNNQGDIVTNLGVHEHWNNSIDKQYSRNLDKDEGVELIYLEIASRAS